MGWARSALCVVSLAIAACQSAAAPGEDAEVASCEPDRACPESAPVFGGPCEGALTCPYEMCGPGGDDVYECRDGEWRLTMPGCLGGSPPIAESCRTPFSGTLPGARLWLSADAAGAPEMTSGGTAEVAFGPQGLAMVPFRIHLDGIDPTSAPACVEITTSLTLDGASGAPVTRNVRLRCGSSLRIQEILPELPCELRPYDVGVDVSVTGVGSSVHLDLSAMGGMCPRGGGGGGGMG